MFAACLYLSVPVVAAVVNPLLHDGVIRIQVDWDVFVLWIKHVAKFLQSAVLWAAAGGVPQVVHDVRHVHFTCNMTTTKRRSKQISWRLWRLSAVQLNILKKHLTSMQTQREVNWNLTWPAQIKEETDWGEVKGKEKTNCQSSSKKCCHCPPE